MIIESILGGIRVTEALQEELIATELFEAGSPWLTVRNVEATAESITGEFTIHALNGEFHYCLDGWCWWLNHVARALLVSAPLGFKNPPTATTSTCD